MYDGSSSYMPSETPYKKSLEPMVLATDVNESSEISSRLQRLRQAEDPVAATKNFIKNLDRVSSKVDCFQNNRHRQGSILKHIKEHPRTEPGSALTNEQLAHQKALIEKQRRAQRANSRLSSHDQKDNVPSKTVFRQMHDEMLRHRRISQQRYEQREAARRSRERGEIVNELRRRNHTADSRLSVHSHISYRSQRSLALQKNAFDDPVQQSKPRSRSYLTSKSRDDEVRSADRTVKETK